MADYTVGHNDAFSAFIKKSEEDEKNRAARGSGNNTGSFTYETQEWVGLVANKPHILRLTGNPPESMTPGFKADKFDAHEIYFETVKDDNGDRMQLRLPCHAADINDEHIMWRIINKVKEVDWVPDPQNPGKKKRVYKHERTLVFDKVTHSGWDVNNPKEADSYKYAKGWGGQQVVIINVIDREDDWCKINKHTKLLSKKISVKDGVAYPTVGVPSYGFLNCLSKLSKVYGPWENYDVQVVKTGQMNTPYEVKNATFYKSAGVPEVDQSKLKFISVEPSLTPEEKEYGRYNIALLYKVTPYRAIRDRLGKTIREIDATLNTHFYDELNGLAEKEIAEIEAKKAEKAENAESAETVAPVMAPTSDPIETPVDTNVAPVQESVAPAATVTPTPAAPVAEQPVARTTRGTANISTLAPEKIAALKGWLKLTPAQKDLITDVILDASGNVENVLYKEEAGNQCNCNNCMKPSPLSFTSCPVCGCDFAD